MLGICALADRAPYQLSGGQKKRVAIASVLVMNPEVLLFDEPTAALDPRTQQWLVELIDELNRAGKTVVVATHDLDHLGLLADRCAVFSEDHRVVAVGPTDQILSDHELLRRSTSCTSTPTSTTEWRTPRARSRSSSRPRDLMASRSVDELEGLRPARTLHVARRGEDQIVGGQLGGHAAHGDPAPVELAANTSW